MRNTGRLQKSIAAVSGNRQVILACVFFGLMAATRTNAEIITVGDQQATATVAMADIDHSTWDALLQKYVNERGMVNYSALKSSAADMQSLEAYLNHLSSAKVEPASAANRNAQLAFWINSYNAVTLHGMLREYPTKSIKDHASRFGGYNIWKHYQLFVDGKPYSLDDMEHKILRKMDEPRIHFAVVCASISCPRLLNRAYVPDKLEEQLQLNTRDFFAQPGNFRYDVGKRRAYLSSIMKWYGTDFAPTAVTQLKKLVEYLPDAAAQQAVTSGKFKVSYQKYDWGINEAK